MEIWDLYNISFVMFYFQGGMIVQRRGVEESNMHAFT